MREEQSKRESERRKEGGNERVREVTTTDIKTNMRHIHTSIVSMHLTTRGNNKILRTPPPHISISEEIPHSSHYCPTQNK